MSSVLEAPNCTPLVNTPTHEYFWILTHKKTYTHKIIDWCEDLFFEAAIIKVIIILFIYCV